jgi:hypothetical protein
LIIPTEDFVPFKTKWIGVVCKKILPGMRKIMPQKGISEGQIKAKLKEKPR